MAEDNIQQNESSHQQPVPDYTSPDQYSAAQYYEYSSGRSTPFSPPQNYGMPQMPPANTPPPWPPVTPYPPTQPARKRNTWLYVMLAIVGVLLAIPINGLTTGVGSFVTFSEVAFKFRVGSNAIVTGLIFAAIIGAIGGFLPAWSASRKNIVTTMRDL